MPTLSLATYPTERLPRCQAPLVSAPWWVSETLGAVSSLTRTVAAKTRMPARSYSGADVGGPVGQPPPSRQIVCAATRRTPPGKVSVRVVPGQLAGYVQSEPSLGA